MLHKKEYSNSFKIILPGIFIVLGIFTSFVIFKNTYAGTVHREEKDSRARSIELIKFTSDTTITKSMRGTYTFESEIDGETKEFQAYYEDWELVSLFVNDEKVSEEEFEKYMPMLNEIIEQHEKDMTQHDEEIKKHDEDIKKHEEGMKQHELDMKRHDEEMAKHDIEMKKQDTFMKYLNELLYARGILKEECEKYSIDLTSKKFIIDGKVMSEKLLNEVKKMYSKYCGKEMDKNFSVKVTYSYHKE